MRWVVVVFALSGCSSILGIEDFRLGDAGTPNDSIDSSTGEFCLGPTGFKVCLAAAPTNAPITISSSLTLDTSPGVSPLCAPTQPASWKAAGQPDACFLISTDVTFSAPVVQAVGTRPLVVFASNAITVGTQLDVATHIGSMMRGAGSPAPGCVAPQAAGNATSGGGGGGGGSFMGKGGDGGNGGSSNNRGAAAPSDSSAPVVLRGGCPGGVGGTGAQPGGAPGAGGGAVYLVAGGRITINGFINASGSGAPGGGQAGGGGGGGSGGMIVLHAPMIGGNGGTLLANGGAAGGGGANQPGQSGTDPQPSMPTSGAIGGAGGGGAGGVGGNGSAGANNLGSTGAAGSPTTAAGGGGGGGGGGYIRANMPIQQITASPSITVVP